MDVLVLEEEPLVQTDAGLQRGNVKDAGVTVKTSHCIHCWKKASGNDHIHFNPNSEVLVSKDLRKVKAAVPMMESN